MPMEIDAFADQTRRHAGNPSSASAIDASAAPNGIVASPDRPMGSRPAVAEQRLRMHAPVSASGASPRAPAGLRESDIDRAALIAGLDARAAAGDDLCAAAAAAIRRGSRSGRPAAYDDRALAEMEEMLAGGTARTIGEAAGLVARTLVGEHSLEAATARLARKFRDNKKLLSHEGGSRALYLLTVEVGERE